MKSSLIPLLLIAAPLALATPNDQYYSPDIFTAIKEAKQRTHHYDYSSALRYNRSTSQSIPIPRLLNTEMAQTAIKTPEIEPDTEAVSTGADTTNLSEDTRLTQAPDNTPRSLPLGTGVPAPASVTVTIR